VTDPYGLAARGIRDPAVLAAMTKVPRRQFVPEAHRHEALADHPLPIGYGQTISQPYIVAWMTEALRVEAHHTVLEVGTGCGYQTAVLAELVARVVSLEVVPELAALARKTLDELGYANVELHVADGYLGWPDAAPFDRILLTAAPPQMPRALLDQLADGGRLVGPEGTAFQTMQIITRRGDGLTRQESIAVRFVPMVRGEDRSGSGLA
jgi:protein-L-isoaspartate(D-aspartate) O-methyltransferase